MTRTEFNRLPLLRTFVSIDEDTNDLIHHEVRRDTHTGLTLTAQRRVPAPTMETN